MQIINQPRTYLNHHCHKLFFNLIKCNTYKKETELYHSKRRWTCCQDAVSADVHFSTGKVWVWLSPAPRRLHPPQSQTLRPTLTWFWPGKSHSASSIHHAGLDRGQRSHLPLLQSENRRAESIPCRWKVWLPPGSTRVDSFPRRKRPLPSFLCFLPLEGSLHPLHCRIHHPNKKQRHIMVSIQEFILQWQWQPMN